MKETPVDMVAHTNWQHGVHSVEIIVTQNNR